MQKLIQTTEFYQTIDLIISPVILIKEERIHQYHNTAVLDQIGYSIADAPDQDTWFSKVYPEESYRTQVMAEWQDCKKKAQAAGSTKVRLVTKIYCRNGLSKWFEVHESTMGASKVITFLDIDELYKNNERLADLLNQKDILLSVIAHDVRSPLSNIRQIVDNYQEMQLSENEMKEIFTKLDDQVEYIYNLINSLLLRTSGVMGIFEEKLETIPLELFFMKYKNYYQERLEKKRVDLQLHFPENAVIDFDPFILDVISRNLIDNAIKYSPENETVHISLHTGEGIHDLIIKDNGRGMTQRQIETILSNQGSRQLKQQVTDGFGLGLVLAKEILEKSGRHLLIKSELGHGTTFIIRLS
jgi:signal transduction histidine kinase